MKGWSSGTKRADPTYQFRDQVRVIPGDELRRTDRLPQPVQAGRMCVGDAPGLPPRTSTADARLKSYEVAVDVEFDAVGLGRKSGRVRGLRAISNARTRKPR